ncbi:twist-related protein 1-like [Solenopsis invicta]|uniref:twist-related protein 1-like n=1 Tax=Solenopsis invicta TaxID=13686 RepID=UPI00193E2A22|nr:twist-related protein 1-like [Solenopsis invicta]
MGFPLRGFSGKMACVRSDSDGGDGDGGGGGGGGGGSSDVGLDKSAQVAETIEILQVVASAVYIETFAVVQPLIITEVQEERRTITTPRSSRPKVHGISS